MATMILAVVVLSMTEDTGWEVVISLPSGFLYSERSNALTFCFSYGTDMGVSSLFWGFGYDLETNKFIEAGEVEGYGGIALAGLGIVERVAVVVVTAVVGIRVANALGSTRGFSVNLTLYCLLFDC